MDVLFVIPPSPEHKLIIRMIDCSYETKANYLWQPNDFIIMTSLLNESDNAFFVDGTADQLDPVAFREQLRKSRCDILVFALSSVCWESDYRFFQDAGKMFHDVPIFVLGDIFLEDSYRQQILMECDGIIYNPFQLDFASMLLMPGNRKGASLPGICTRPGQRFFESGTQPIRITAGTPRHELFMKRRYRFPFARHFRFTTVTTMWGCPFSCTYCTDSNFPPLVRSHGDVIRELAYIRDLGIKELFIADKAFGFFSSEAVPILEEMTKSFRFAWSCYFHPQVYNARILEMMHAAGCHTIIVGIDSANVPALRRYKRVVDPIKIDAIIAHANRLGMSICADFILGLEHETARDVKRTIDYALKLPIDYASFNVAAPLPGSDIRKKAIHSGKMSFGVEGFDTSGRGGIIGSDSISVDVIKRLRREAFIKFYLRPSYLLRRLRKVASTEHLAVQLIEMLSMLKKIR
ncbi:MAG: radical SAM protein [Nitrospiraceae bacterium]|nr:radical SAM protein [Nitrospiraceae bacterium]